MKKARDYLEKISAGKALLSVDFLPEEGTWFEGENFSGCDGKRFAGLRIAPGPVALLLHDEFAEAGKLDFLTGCQGFLDNVQDGLHNCFSFFSLEVAVGANVFYQVFFCHGKDFYHISHGKGKRESPEGPLYGSNLPEI